MCSVHPPRTNMSEHVAPQLVHLTVFQRQTLQNANHWNLIERSALCDRSCRTPACTKETTTCDVPPFDGSQSGQGMDVVDDAV